MVRQFTSLASMRDYVLNNPVLSWLGDPDDDCYNFFDNPFPGLFVTFDSYEDLSSFFASCVDVQLSLF